jgi:hypothetical protein
MYLWCRLKADGLFPRRQKSRFVKTKPASWELEDQREKSQPAREPASDKDKEKPVAVRRTPVGIVYVQGWFHSAGSNFSSYFTILYSCNIYNNEADNLILKGLPHEIQTG